MFTPKPNSNYKLWKIHPKKKKILREIVDQNIKIISESVTEDLISKDYSFLKKDFDSELIKTFLKYNLIALSISSLFLIGQHPPKDTKWL